MNVNRLFVAALVVVPGFGAGIVTPKVDVPPAYHQARSAADPSGPELGSWWHKFGDPTLDSLIAHALSDNYDLEQAAARIRETRALAGVDKSALLPSVNASSGVQNLRGGFSQGIAHIGGAGHTGSFVSPFETGLWQSGFDARWEIDFFGGQRKNRDAAKADWRASEENARDVRVTLCAEVARNYLELRGTQTRLAIAIRNRDAQQDTLDLTRVRADAGLATQFDVERQAAQLATTSAAVPALEQSRDALIHRLSVLIGREPGTLLEDLRPTADLPAEPPTLPSDLPAALLTRRPDLRRLDAELAAASLRLGVAKSDLYPKIILNGLTGRQTTTFTGITLGGGNFFSLGPSIQLPLFNGGRIRGNIAAQQARLEQVSARFQEQVLIALEETENALSAHRHEQQRSAHLTVAVLSSREATSLSQELFTRGLGDFLAVLDAQRAQYQAEDELARSETIVRQQIVAVYKAMGGGWQ